METNEVDHLNTYFGTAGWTVPSHIGNHAADSASHLEKYSSLLNAVEINSSFYRDHQPGTYEKWAEITPDDFRFSVKLSRYFTQEMKLQESGERLKQTLTSISHLGRKWGALLVQLPPSLKFDQKTASRFTGELREMYSGPIVWEPRNKTWASAIAIDLLLQHGINKVLADPEPCPIAKENRQFVELTRYYRLHGTPEIYKSCYGHDVLKRIATSLIHPISPATHTWIIFDNTASGHAIENAIELKQLIRENIFAEMLAQ